MIIFIKTTTFPSCRRDIFVCHFSQNISNNGCDVKPVVLYNNADTDKTQIFTDNRGKSGIYCWTNKFNRKIYVGSSSNISVRMYKYFDLPYLAKSNRLIEIALLAHDFSNFTLEILEYSPLI